MVSRQPIQLVAVWTKLKHHEIAPGTFQLVLEIVWLVSVQIWLGAAQCQKGSNRVRIEERAFNVHLMASAKNRIAIFGH